MATLAPGGGPAAGLAGLLVGQVPTRASRSGLPRLARLVGLGLRPS